MDPWAVTPTERARHEEQFRTLGPNPMGFVTGNQARNFMLQSGLQPMILAKVWGLADINGDGMMDINEFSVACKLVADKLKGVELPEVLPPSLMPAQMHGMMPMMQQQGMVRMSAAGGMGMMGMGMGPGMAHGMAPGMAPGMMPGMAQAGMMGMMGTPVSSAGMMGMGMGMGMGAGMAPGMMGPGMVASQAGMMPVTSVATSGMMQTTAMPPVAPVQPSVQPAASMVPAAASSAPGSGTASPAPISMEWAVPQMMRTKYLATFQQTDRGRTGFIAGVQARNILLQSGLPQNILAQIWSLSDYDNDGRLSSEEFILAGHLCEMAQKGEPLPSQLPANLIPPTLRKGGAQPGTPVAGPATGMVTPTTFEDKRKENFDKGQEVLEKRRQSLIEEQKKLEEERKRKEKEEAEAKEKQKREAERRRQAEIERQLQKQREAEEQRRLAEEKKRAARQEMERQRLKEWEENRREELKQHKMREEEKLMTMKARKEHLGTDLETLREKVKTLTDQISETRTGVTDVKTFIDGMRSSRDTKMADMTSLKTQLKDQNERLIKVTQEKAKMDAKNRARQAKVEEGNETELTEFDIKKKEKEEKVVELRAKLAALKETEEATRNKYNSEKAALDEHREQLKLIIESCKDLYSQFEDKRREIKAEKAKRIRELTDPDHAWDAVPEQAAAAPATAQSPTFDDVPATPAAQAGSDDDGVQYRALYDYASENPDDLSFKAGDIILVHLNQPHEPGWLGGEFNGKVGWFPEAYAEPAGSEPVGSEPAAAAQDGAADSDQYVALFAYTSTEPGDLTFEAGEEIQVVKKENEWWTGKIGDREGVFPYNYVEPAKSATASAAPAALGASEEKVEDEQPASIVPETGPPEDVGLSSDSDKKKDVSWNGSASHVAHQVDSASEAEEKPGLERQQSAKSRVSFDQPEAGQQAAAGDRKDSFTGVTRVSFEKPADLYVTSAPATAEQAKAAEPEAKVEASNTGTAKRKSKKKRDEDGKSGKKPELATVIAPYSASGKEQLTLQKGQMILVRKKTETGWWQGEIQASGTGTKGRKRQIGWFPASYVKLMGGGGAEKPAAPAAEEPAAPTAATADEAPAASKDEKPQFRALYSYAGQHDDELPFNAGDIISLISKEEEAWWKGELDGRIGVFPSNYVEEIN